MEPTIIYEIVPSIKRNAVSYHISHLSIRNKIYVPRRDKKFERLSERPRWLLLNFQLGR